MVRACVCLRLAFIVSKKLKNFLLCLIKNIFLTFVFVPPSLRNTLLYLIVPLKCWCHRNKVADGINCGNNSWGNISGKKFPILKRNRFPRKYFRSAEWHLYSLLTIILVTAFFFHQNDWIHQIDFKPFFFVDKKSNLNRPFIFNFIQLANCKFLFKSNF